MPLAGSAQVSVGVGFTIGSPPPALPYYTQPAAPYPNYQWQPGYWAWGPAGYYWVPGTWIAPPSVGLYWTPGYWGYNNGYYGFNAGYWGASVGFYGGINYGYGYPGSGFYGGAWNGGNFAYNTAVANVNRTVIHNTYNKTVINKNVCNNCKNVSFNGGKGGTTARPTQGQIEARKNGRPPTTAQVQQAKVAAQDRNLYANVNKGKPPVTAVQKPIEDPKQLPKYAPVTAADKQAAQKQVHTANNNSNNTNATQNKPANSMQSKPANSMQNNKPANSMQSKPQNSMQSKPSSQQPQHHKPPSNAMQSSTHKPPSSMNSAHQGNMNHNTMQSRPPQGQNKNGQGKPPASNNNGGNKPQNNGGSKPPRG
jgi:hypothetical protein